MNARFDAPPLSRLAMRFAMLLVGAALCGATATIATADDASFAAVATLSNASGEDIYSRICQGCHMPHGEGAIGAGHYPKLAGDPTLASWQFAALTVLGGRNGMPAFGAAPGQVWDGPTVHLSDAQVADVVNYLRSHFGNNFKDRVTAGQVAKLPHPAIAAAP
jgi:mono/diheme cytochrome c family protein